MFHNLAVDMACLLIKHEILDIEQRDVYVYGIEVVLLNGGLIIIYLILSLLFNAMINFWAYMIFFLLLRSFAGGYHAETSEHCFVFSILMYALSIAVTKLFPDLYQDWYWRFGGIVSIAIILFLSPLINENNPLNKSQKKRNRIIVYLLLTAAVVFFVLCCNFEWAVASNELVFIIFVALLLLAGKSKLYFNEDLEL